MMRGVISWMMFFVVLWPCATAQPQPYPFDIPRYDFIHYQQNHLHLPARDSAYSRLFSKINKLVTQGEGKINVVHIGGSHIQADIYTHRMREKLQSISMDMNGGRGLVFPYAAAQTNNPGNYEVQYSGSWSHCKNVQKSRDCVLGLTGMSVSTRETDASISIRMSDRNALSYDFNRIQVFHQLQPESFRLRLQDTALVDSIIPDPSRGKTDIYLKQPQDGFTLKLLQTDSIQQFFTLYGFNLVDEDPGLVYHSVGVNGSKLESFLRCQLFVPHLSLLEPDWVILSIGTNDAYTRYFDLSRFERQYDSLIAMVREGAPDAAILITVPNDSYLYRRYTNKNTQQMEQAITRLAARHHAGFWDLYKIMGGLNSIVVWQRFGLAKRDRIHFTRQGYLLKGDLFFNAFLKAMDDYLDHRQAFSGTTGP